MVQINGSIPHMYKTIHTGLDRIKGIPTFDRIKGIPTFDNSVRYFFPVHQSDFNCVCIGYNFVLKMLFKGINTKSINSINTLASCTNDVQNIIKFRNDEISFVSIKN